MKGRRIIILASLKKRPVDQLHVNHMGIENTRPLACKSIYWTNKNADIKNIIKNCP